MIPLPDGYRVVSLWATRNREQAEESLARGSYHDFVSSNDPAVGVVLVPTDPDEPVQAVVAGLYGFHIIGGMDMLVLRPDEDVHDVGKEILAWAEHKLKQGVSK